MRQLQLTGLNHTTAPVELREKLALPAARSAEATGAFLSRFGTRGVVFLSTCNRSEAYCVAEDQADVAAFWADFFGVRRGDFEPSLYRKTGRDAADHLFRVTASLDSIVLGETQILGQVRAAYDAAVECRATGPLLNGLFQRAMGAAKRVMSRTRLGDGRVSAASVAVDYARTIFEHFHDKTVLCIGSGKMVSLILRHFGALRPGRVVVAARDRGRAEDLARRCHVAGATGAAMDSLAEHLVAADIVVTSTASPCPVITREMFQRLARARRYRPVFMIDLAVPRDIEPGVGGLPNVFLYNIDDLQRVVGQSQQLRGAAVEQAQRIVQDAVADLVAWDRQRELGPAIRGLYQRQYELARRELRRTLRGGALGDQQIDQLARKLVNKLLHDPMRALRSPNSSHDGARYVHAINRLFGLGIDGPAAAVSAVNSDDSQLA